MVVQLLSAITACSASISTPEQSTLGVCSVTPPPGYHVRMFRSQMLSALTYTLASDGATSMLKLTRLAPVQGAQKASRERLNSDAADSARSLPAVSKLLGDPMPKLVSRLTSFRGYTALEQFLTEHSAKESSETFILKFIVSDDEYWLSRSVSAPKITRRIRSRTLKDWSFFKNHLKIAVTHPGESHHLPRVGP